jgi:ribosomal protein L37AE/L43A
VAVEVPPEVLCDIWCPECEVEWVSDALPGCWICGKVGERYSGRNMLEEQADARIRQALTIRESLRGA